jgi:hypothetical protein
VAELLVVVMWSDPRVLVPPYCMVSRDHFRLVGQFASTGDATVRYMC